jgi:ABC-type ATPase involved in cell division
MSMNCSAEKVKRKDLNLVQSLFGIVYQHFRCLCKRGRLNMFIFFQGEVEERIQETVH